MKRQLPFLLPTNNETPEAFHFAVEPFLPVTLFYTSQKEAIQWEYSELSAFRQLWKQETEYKAWRRHYLDCFGIPQNRPVFRISNHLFAGVCLLGW